MPVPALMNWSGGKDSALALYHALRDPRYQVSHLLTSVNAHFERVSMHGVRLPLLEAQARRIGLPLVQLRLPEMPGMAEYELQMQTTLDPLVRAGVRHSIFGDIFLEDLRAYREEQLSRLGMQAVFPLWQRPGADILREYLDLGFRAVVVCVNDQHLDASFCGRLLDREFLRDLPPGVDPCGENGEYHSFIFDAPYFSSPIGFERGELVRRTYQPARAGSGADDVPDPFQAGFWYCDLLPVEGN
ncbi:diphthine--ammonia ligase [Hymenobacter sp. BT175]|uniref:Dph6-related ATP pyrophosphatase n=1 Tax=Hymenobacter translucens TaxID=2886507 RepID=UPI001D0E397A|nr:diphthine--ammonia ligase [Hymenobacter translucens]MCC2547181.1 diphthine--ammonia ligase [Hymenobacter translucens]